MQAASAAPAEPKVQSEINLGVKDASPADEETKKSFACLITHFATPLEYTLR